MSIQDAYCRFSEGQVITETADSETVWDQGAGETEWGAAKAHPEIAEGKPLYLNVVSKAAFDASGAGTLTISLESCATVDGSYTSHFSTSALGLSALTAGARQLAMALPLGLLRYVKLVYTVASGPMTAGSVDAWVGLEPVPAK